nr:hypothetical protein Itr_chr12CG10500 [Ipomoea trifida]
MHYCSTPINAVDVLHITVLHVMSGQWMFCHIIVLHVMRSANHVAFVTVRHVMRSANHVASVITLILYITVRHVRRSANHVAFVTVRHVMRYEVTGGQNATATPFYPVVNDQTVVPRAQFNVIVMPEEPQFNAYSEASATLPQGQTAISALGLLVQEHKSRRRSHEDLGPLLTGLNTPAPLSPLEAIIYPSSSMSPLANVLPTPAVLNLKISGLKNPDAAKWSLKAGPIRLASVYWTELRDAARQFGIGANCSQKISSAASNTGSEE